MCLARTATIEKFRGLIERLGGGGYDRSLIYSGLRGVGKTPGSASSGRCGW